MRRVVIGTMAAVALSWAGGALAADAAKERREAADATKAETREKARETRSEMGQQSQQAKESAGRQADRAQARAGAAGQEKKHPLFEGKNNFDLDGKVAQVSGNSLTIQREDLPSAKLHISQSTKVELDGKQASLQELKPGQDVKASFNLRGDRAEAVEIKAEKLEKGAQKEMSEQRRETQKEMGERARESQQPQQQKQK